MAAVWMWRLRETEREGNQIKVIKGCYNRRRCGGRINMHRQECRIATKTDNDVMYSKDRSYWIFRKETSPSMLGFTGGQGEKGEKQAEPTEDIDAKAWNRGELRV